jgi:hypothetical protein
VHQVLEWVDLGRASADEVHRIAAARRPSTGSTRSRDAAARGGGSAALRCRDGARPDARRIWRELPLSFPTAATWSRASSTSVFEEEDGLVIVDYKTDRITAEQAVAQAAHHAPQLQLYGAAWRRPGACRSRTPGAVHLHRPSVRV